jgi:uncharacterized protein YraI
MKKRQSTLLFLAAILILACSCPLVSSTAVNPAATTSVSPTNTAAAGAPPATSAAATTGPVVPVGPPAASPSGQPVNCRSGPDTSWSVVIILSPGQTVEIVGKTADGTWLEVKNPSLAGSFCWVSSGVVTTTGNLSGVAIVAAPPTSVVPTAVAAVVKSISVSVSPTEIHVGGCMGPIQPSTAFATIEVTGATKLNWHFDTKQNGALSIHSVSFNKAQAKDVSETFTPPLTAGTYWIRLEIDGVDLSGFDNQATYTISC